MRLRCGNVQILALVCPGYSDKISLQNPANLFYQFICSLLGFRLNPPPQHSNSSPPHSKVSLCVPGPPVHESRYDRILPHYIVLGSFPREPVSPYRLILRDLTTRYISQNIILPLPLYTKSVSRSASPPSIFRKPRLVSLNSSYLHPPSISQITFVIYNKSSLKKQRGSVRCT